MTGERKKGGLRIGLVGAGRMGSIHAANIVSARGMVLSAVHDPDERACRRMGREHGAKAATMRQLLGDMIDAVVIASPASRHLLHARTCVLAKKPFLCEKPLSDKRAGVAELAREAKRNKVFAMMGFNRRFDKKIASLAGKVRSGKLGKIQSMRFVSRSDVPTGTEYARHSGGLLRDKGAHFFDLACWLSGKLPVRVHASGFVFSDRKLALVGDIDAAMVTLELEDNILCQFDFSRHSACGHDERIEVAGTKGIAWYSMNPKVGAAGASVVISSATKKKAPGWQEHYAASFQAELVAFAKALRQEKESPVPIEAGYLAEEIAACALDSMKTRQAKPVGLAGVVKR